MPHTTLVSADGSTIQVQLSLSANFSQTTPQATSPPPLAAPPPSPYPSPEESMGAHKLRLYAQPDDDGSKFEPPPTQQSLWTPGAQPTSPQPTPAAPAEPVWTIRDVYEAYLKPDDVVTKAASTISGHYTNIAHFERLCGLLYVEQQRSQTPAVFSGPNVENPRTMYPGVQNGGSLSPLSAPNPPLQEIDEDLLVQLRNKLLSEGLSGDTCRKMFSTVKRVMRAARKRKLVGDVPDLPAIPKTSGRAGVVECDEVGALYEAAAVARWPRAMGIPASAWWRCWFVLFWYYGARTQDFVGYKTSTDTGLLWSSLTDDVRCPDRSIKRDRQVIECPAGWLEYVPEKTKRSKGESLILPRCEIVNAHLATFQQLDPERVFPNGRSKKKFSETWHAIRTEADVPADVSIADTGVRNGRKMRSIRKGCSNNWDDAREGLGEWVLGHAAKGTNHAHYKLMLPAMVDLIGELEIPQAFQDGLEKLPKVQRQLI